MHRDPDSSDFEYDEFGFFDENRSEYALAGAGMPPVRRVSYRASCGDVSALRWGDGPLDAVLIHGTAQNAHTWDTVMLALGEEVSALVVDLPGHGHSSWRDDARYDPHSNADALSEVLAELADAGDLSAPVVLVGMSLGGLTANRLAAQRADDVGRLVVVDITPGVTAHKAKEIHDFIAGPQTFADFAQIMDRTVEFNPTRTRSSLRRGILHNAHRLPDGSWEWNYHRATPAGDGFASRDELWQDVARTVAPYLLVRGADSPVTDDADVAELLRHREDARIVTVEGAGHSIQGDRPVELAGLLADELAAAAP
ncbi:MAG: alpha/beta hydrolase [Microthrixaceae bacterium]|nr:alpha/beta hydrolase [Microthrixaceae bacterium]MCB9387757.1 alpha/beta hydrolase [Microthrixaceae bacterium]